MKALGRVACLTVLCVGPVLAGLDIEHDARPTDDRSLAPEEKALAYPGIIGTRMTDPSLTSAVSPPGLALQLSTERKSGKAAAKIGLRIGNDLFFDVKFSVPFGDAEDDVEPLDLDGLARSSVVDLGIHLLLWNPKMDVEKAKAIRAEYLVRNPREKNFVLSLNNLNSEPDLKRRFLEAITWKTAFFAALRAKAGRQDFTYADTEFRSHSEQKASLALEAASGALLPGWGYFGLSFERQRFHEAGTTVDLILPYRGGPVQQIKTMVMGPPAARTRTRLQVEFRRTIGSFAAVNPRATYFPGEKAVLLELPVFLFRNPEAGLNGGVNLAWTSKSDGRFGLALFIGSAFSLTPE